MAFPVSTRSAGELITAVIWNADLKDNLTTLRAGGIAIASQGANEIIFASSATQLSRSAGLTFNGSLLSVTGAGSFSTTLGIGIGTATSKLQVYDDTANPFITITGRNVVGGIQGVLFQHAVANAAGFIGSITASGGGAGDLVFSSQTQSAGERMRIHSSGGVSIGNTTDPGASVISVSGFGNHSFAASGTGPNSLIVRNTTAGTGNYAYLSAGADGGLALNMLMFSSTWTTTGNQVQSGGSLETGGSGGLSLAATHASGVLRLYGNGTTQRMQVAAGVTVGDTTDPGATNFRVAGTSALVGAVTLSSTLTLGGNLIAGSNWISGDGGNEGIRIDAAGSVYIGDTTNANVTVGLTINQGTNINSAFALKQQDVAHGITDRAETDTYALLYPTGGASGGLGLNALTETTLAVDAHAYYTTGDTTKSTAGFGAYAFAASKKSGASSGAMTADENIIVFRNDTTTRFILDADGDSHQDVGTAWTNFDEFDDVALLTALSAGVSRKGDPLREQFGALLEQYRPQLEQARVVTFNADGHHFVNWSRLNMLKVGAIRQLSDKVAALSQELAAVRALLPAPAATDRTAQ